MQNGISLGLCCGFPDGGDQVKSGRMDCLINYEPHWGLLVVEMTAVDCARAECDAAARSTVTACSPSEPSQLNKTTEGR